MLKRLHLTCILIAFSVFSFAQGTNCSTADPFCTGTTYTFPNSTSTASLGTINCCYSTPNPAWYYMQLDVGGNMTIQINQTSSSGSGLDVDFVLFGPYSSLPSACATIPGGAVEDCSYSAAAVEYADITGGIVGEYYVLLLTNYSDQPGTITFSQTGGTASANCSLLCGVTGFTANPSACDPATNTYSVSGVLGITTPPGSGTLTFTNSCGGTPVVVSAPFPASIPYSFSGLTSMGGSCTVSATFSADATCNSTVSYTAPGDCTPAATFCTLTVNGTPSACNPATNFYSLSGSLNFANPPTTGTLTVSTSCGGTQTFSAPFTSPIAYNLTGLNSNGLGCTINAAFSDSAGCTATASYTAPANCMPPVYCSLTVSGTPSACDPATNFYNVSGNLTFANPPATGTLTVSTTCGGTQTFSAPFTSPIAYNLTGLNSDGSGCTINAAFSDSSACTATASYTAPVNCIPVCNMSSVTASVSGCNPMTNTYTVSGNITFVNAPSTGTLTVTSSCGSSQTFSAPFTSPQAYSFTGLPAGSGTCTITAVFSAAPSCTNSASYIVPGPPVITPVSPLCITAGPFTLNATPTGGVWSGSGTSGTGTFTPGTAGAGSHTVIYINGGACPLSDSTTVVVNPLPTVTAPADDSICAGGSVSLPVSGTAVLFSWSPSTGLSSASSSNPTASPSGTTTYTVTGTDAVGCSNTDNVTVYVSPSPTVTISPITSICAGDSVQLDASGAASYSWTPSTGLSSSTISNPYASPASTQTYTVTGTSANGCTGTATTTVTVIDPSASFTATPSTGTAPLTVSFDNTSSGTFYYWNFGNGLSDTTTSATPDAGTVYDSVGTYTVILISIEGGCVDTTSMTIVVNPVSSLLVPNIITANSDGKNDEFKIIATALSSLNVDIFNRWGEKVGNINTPDGKWSGNDHSPGTYYYILSAVGFDGQTWNLTGNFSLVK